MGNELVKDRLNSVADQAATVPGISDETVTAINTKVGSISQKLDWTKGKDTSALTAEVAHVNPKDSPPDGKPRSGGRVGGGGTLGLIFDMGMLLYDAFRSGQGEWFRDIGITDRENRLDEDQLELDRCLDDLCKQTQDCVDAVDEIDSNAEDGVLAILDRVLWFIGIVKWGLFSSFGSSVGVVVLFSLGRVENTIEDRNKTMGKCWESLESVYDDVCKTHPAPLTDHYSSAEDAATRPDREVPGPEQHEQPANEPPITGSAEPPVKPAGVQPAPAPAPTPGPAPASTPSAVSAAAPASAPLEVPRMEAPPAPTIPTSVATTPAGFAAGAGAANFNVNVNVSVGGDLGSSATGSGVFAPPEPPTPPAPSALPAQLAPPALPALPSLPSVPPVGPAGQCAIGQFIAGVEEIKQMVMDCLPEAEVPPETGCECSPEEPANNSEDSPEKPAPEAPAPDEPATEKPAPPPELAEVKEPPPPPKQSVAPAGAGEIGGPNDIAPPEPKTPTDAPASSPEPGDTDNHSDNDERTRKTRTW
nr:Uncharacterised protein [Streptococcus thermophilus]